MKVKKMQTMISRIPVTNDELAVEMQNEGMTEFKNKVIFLQSVLKNKQWHNIKLTEEDVKKYTPVFLNYLKSVQEA